MQIMFYTIYQITNLLNGKIYIGKHQTKNLDDEYMGSGKHLKRAIAKYGIENFKKEILFQFDNESDMNVKESDLVTEEFCLREDTYNICVGGQGGFSYINQNDLGVKIQKQRELDETLSKRSSILGGNKVKELFKNTTFKKRVGGRISNSLKQHYKNGGVYPMLGKSHTEETKTKIGKSNSKMVGSANSQYGTMWITNGQENKKIKKDVDTIPEGWYKGRK